MAQCHGFKGAAWCALLLAVAVTGAQASSGLVSEIEWEDEQVVEDPSSLVQRVSVYPRSNDHGHYDDPDYDKAVSRMAGGSEANAHPPRTHNPGTNQKRKQDHDSASKPLGGGDHRPILKGSHTRPRRGHGGPEWQGDLPTRREETMFNGFHQEGIDGEDPRHHFLTTSDRIEQHWDGSSGKGRREKKGHTKRANMFKQRPILRGDYLPSHHPSHERYHPGNGLNDKQAHDSGQESGSSHSADNNLRNLV